jgi:hypothetical protein
MIGQESTEANGNQEKIPKFDPNDIDEGIRSYLREVLNGEFIGIVPTEVDIWNRKYPEKR